MTLHTMKEAKYDYLNYKYEVNHSAAKKNSVVYIKMEVYERKIALFSTALSASGNQILFHALCNAWQKKE